MTWETSADPVDFEEAIVWLRERVPIANADLDELVAAARDKAFTVAGVAQLDVVQQVFDALERAVAFGTDLTAFKRAVGESLRAAWQGSVPDPAWRIETIFRTNLQLAYAAGRHAMATDPAVLGVRPYWLYDAILDGRTTEHCRRWDGVVLPADHRAWLTHNPPAHFNCRATLTTLTEEQAQSMGATKRPPGVQAAEGFGAPPDTAPPWQPDPKDYDPELWSKRKLEEQRR